MKDYRNFVLHRNIEEKQVKFRLNWIHIFKEFKGKFTSLLDSVMLLHEVTMASVQIQFAKVSQANYFTGWINFTGYHACISTEYKVCGL